MRITGKFTTKVTHCFVAQVFSRPEIPADSKAIKHNCQYGEKSKIPGDRIAGRKIQSRINAVIRITSVNSPSFWVAAVPDSNGNFSAEVPAGQYNLVFAGDYYYANKKLYGARQDKPVTVTAKPPQTIQAATIDSFIEAYRRYCDIPGVSLAIVKDGKLVTFCPFAKLVSISRANNFINFIADYLRAEI